jgi:hypothetical protein
VDYATGEPLFSLSTKNNISSGLLAGLFAAQSVWHLVGGYLWNRLDYAIKCYPHRRMLAKINQRLNIMLAHNYFLKTGRKPWQPEPDYELLESGETVTPAERLLKAYFEDHYEGLQRNGLDDPVLYSQDQPLTALPRRLYSRSLRWDFSGPGISSVWHSLKVTMDDSWNFIIILAPEDLGRVFENPHYLLSAILDSIIQKLNSAELENSPASLWFLPSDEETFSNELLQNYSSAMRWGIFLRDQAKNTERFSKPSFFEILKLNSEETDPAKIRTKINQQRLEILRGFFKQINLPLQETVDVDLAQQCFYSFASANDESTRKHYRECLNKLGYWEAPEMILCDSSTRAGYLKNISFYRSFKLPSRWRASSGWLWELTRRFQSRFGFPAWSWATYQNQAWWLETGLAWFLVGAFGLLTPHAVTLAWGAFLLLHLDRQPGRPQRIWVALIQSLGVLLAHHLGLLWVLVFAGSFLWHWLINFLIAAWMGTIVKAGNSVGAPMPRNLQESPSAEGAPGQMQTYIGLATFKPNEFLIRRWGMLDKWFGQNFRKSLIQTGLSLLRILAILPQSQRESQPGYGVHVSPLVQERLLRYWNFHSFALQTDVAQLPDIMPFQPTAQAQDKMEDVKFLVEII